MGVSINYRGKLNDPELIDPFCEEMEDISKEMDWEYNILTEDLNKPNTSYIDEGEIKGHIPLKGINIKVHPKAETLSFLFDKYGNLRSLFMMAWMTEEQLKEAYLFVKTQFAPIEAHITIVKLLQYIKKKYINNLEVKDEGEYWNTEDQALLKEKIDFLNMKMDEVGDLLSNVKKEDGETMESIAEKIERVLRNKFKRG